MSHQKQGASMNRRALVGFECSGHVREALRKQGWDAWSCDLKPAEDGSEHHMQCDFFEALHSGDWDLVIAHPPCTYLCSSGLHWNKRRPEREQKTAEAMALFLNVVRETAHVPYVAIENPIGRPGTRYRKADQIVQPYQFGDDASKATCLWLKGLPTLIPTEYVEPRIVDGKKRWANQTDSGQNKLGPSEQRATERSRTYDGIANAMADQWTRYINEQEV